MLIYKTKHLQIKIYPIIGFNNLKYNNNNNHNKHNNLIEVNNAINFNNKLNFKNLKIK